MQRRSNLQYCAFQAPNSHLLASIAPAGKRIDLQPLPLMRKLVLRTRHCHRHTPRVPPGYTPAPPGLLGHPWGAPGARSRP